MENNNLTPDTTFPYQLFRFAHKRALDSVSTSYFAVVSKDSNPVGLVLTVDIDEHWHHARQAATTLWQMFVREFNHSESRSTLNRFEESLKELNKAVVKTQEKVKQTISVAAIVLEGNQIHFSTIGTSRILLHRSGKLNDVATGSTKNGNQFAAVTSGDLDSSDTLIVANQNLYEFIAAETEDLWENGSAEELSKKILSRTQNSEYSLNCVILRYDTNNPSQTTLYWEESEKHYPIKLPKIPALKIPKIDMQKVGLFMGKAIDLLKNVRKIKLPKTKTAKKFALPKAIRPVSVYIAVLVVVVAASIWLMNRPKSNDGTASAPETSVIDQFTATEESNRVSFLLNLAQSGDVSALSPDETTQLIALASNSGTDAVIPSGKISELPDRAVSISSVGGSLFVLDEKGQLWQIGVDDQLKQIDHTIKINSPVSLVAFSETSLVASDTLGNVWHYNGETAGPLSLSLPANLSSGEKLLARYLENLYLYSEKNNAIYRQTSFVDSIRSTSPYSGTTSLSGSKVWSWAINGDFLFLTDKSNITGLLRDKITVTPFASPRSGDTSRLASEDETIVVSDEQLLSLYNTDGTLIWQKLYLTDEQITDVAISGKVLWLSIGKDIYRLTI